MMQKSVLHILVLFFLATSCKVQNKTVVGAGSTGDRKENQKEEGPYFSSIKTEYILKDSLEVVVFLEAKVENLKRNDINDIQDIAKRIKASWLLQTPTGIKEKLEAGKVNMGEGKNSLSDNLLYLQFTIPRLRDHNEAVLALEFIDLSASRKFTNETYIDFSGSRPNRRFGMYISGSDKPSFESFIRVGQKTVFKSMDGFSHNLVIKRYSSTSPAALSPMSTSKRNELVNYVEQETIAIKSGQELIFDKEGSYILFDNENNLENGYGFLVVNEHYPRLTKAEDLTQPLVYMSTNDEINKLQETKDFKKALDLYFLTMTSGNQAVAKRIIKTYFRRVEKSNELFTTYKEGWKTDKGMIYLVLGPPSRIQRNGLREVWLYSQSANFSEIIFTFYRKPNQFSEDHYELVRYPEYGAYWYPFVEAWRTGSVLE